MDNTYSIAKILTSIGALNWGLIGLIEFNLVDYLFGEKASLSKAVYIIVGLSGIAVVSSLFQNKAVINK